MTKLSVLAGLALIASSALMTAPAEAQSRSNGSPYWKPLPVPTRNGTINYRPTADNIFPRQAAPLPRRVIVRHSETFVRRR